MATWKTIIARLLPRDNATWSQLGISEESNKNQTCILKERVYVLVFLIN